MQILGYYQFVSSEINGHCPIKINVRLGKFIHTGLYMQLETASQNAKKCSVKNIAVRIRQMLCKLDGITRKNTTFYLLTITYTSLCKIYQLYAAIVFHTFLYFATKLSCLTNLRCSFQLY